MFQSKKKKKITVPTIETTQVTVPTLAGLKTAGVTAVEAARQWSGEQAHQAADWAQPRLEHSREAAAAAATAAGAAAAVRAEQGNERLSELVSQAKEKGGQVRSEAEARRLEAVRSLRGEAEKTRKQAKKSKKQLAKKSSKNEGGVLSGLLATLGILAVAGAVAAFVAKKQAQPKEDPWARPLTDPYVAPATGSASSTGATATGTTTATTNTTGTATGTAAGTGSETVIGDGGALPVSEVGETPPAKLDDEDVVDLTAGGLPPESDVEARDSSGRTLGDAVDRDGDHRQN
ncbi:hypothetical protein [Agilicoccus flavus]|uniref:hypothetical protein n=1 Tax=Agilicoccus flavus TaxID=2775968 RepID=UPI001CF6BE96|nr:hypothetical protein [Agilicoccus flavus]